MTKNILLQLVMGWPPKSARLTRLIPCFKQVNIVILWTGVWSIRELHSIYFRVWVRVQQNFFFTFSLRQWSVFSISRSSNNSFDSNDLLSTLITLLVENTLSNSPFNAGKENNSWISIKVLAHSELLQQASAPAPSRGDFKPGNQSGLVPANRALYFLAFPNLVYSIPEKCPLLIVGQVLP